MKNDEKVPREEGRHLRNVRIVVFAAAAAMILIGVIDREYLIVLQKAVRICLECIGIG